MMVCPFCTQDDVWVVRIDGTKEEFVLCCECDTVWDNLSEISPQYGEDLDEYICKRGLTVKPRAITKIKKL